MSVALTAAAPLAACRDLVVRYGRGRILVSALAGVDLDILPDDALALWGRSGSGKTTLLHALGGLVTPSRGRVDWEGAPLSTLDETARTGIRASGIAYVFQNVNLLPSLTAVENVAFAERAAARGGRGDDGPGPLDLLELVGLAAKADHLPDELSGGEAQRVAIARALAQRPRMLLCDEPTGQLDSDTGSRVLDLIFALRGEIGFALVLATHDADLAARMEREVDLLEGRVVRSRP